MFLVSQRIKKNSLPEPNHGVSAPSETAERKNANTKIKLKRKQTHTHTNQLK